MNKDFVPFEEALQLKELGLKIKSPAFYNPNGVSFYKWKEVEENDEAISLLEIIKYYDDLIKDRVDIPTFSQAFRWFREKYKLYCLPEPSGSWRYICNYRGEDLNGKHWSGYLRDERRNVLFYNSYEEAELACLRKLIEIVKGYETYRERNN